MAREIKRVNRFVGAGLDFQVGGVFGGLEEVPGFAVLLEAHLFGFAVGIKAEHGLGGADFDGDDVPDVERDDVGGDEVDVFFGIDGTAFAGGVSGAGFVSLGADGFGAFDLNAEEAGSVVEDEVVAKAVSPGAGDAEFEVDGFVVKGGFGVLSGDLGIFAPGGLALAACAVGVGGGHRLLGCGP